MKKVTVIDSIMGSGKTSWAIEHMSKASATEKFIYITPFRKEIERIQQSVVGRQFTTPTNDNEERRKLRSLKDRVLNNENIAATHSLFQSADDELVSLIKQAGYTLILDEVMDVIERANIRGTDIRNMLAAGLIEVDEKTNQVRWIDDMNDGGRYSDIRLLADAGNLFQFAGKFLLWTFPPRVFGAFQDVKVMTYLFDAQIQRYYYDLHKIDYEYNAVSKVDGEYTLMEYDRQQENRQEIMSLIDVYDGPLNDIGENNNAFGSNWLRRADSTKLGKIKRNTYNYFYNIADVKGSETLWTTLMERKDVLCPRGYKKGFVQHNLRATNEYKDRRVLAYLFNKFMTPEQERFFVDQGVRVNEELFAVSELLQWIYRSRIREGEPVEVYLPSSRMRSLLKAWANYEI